MQTLKSILSVKDQLLLCSSRALPGIRASVIDTYGSAGRRAPSVLRAYRDPFRALHRLPAARVPSELRRLRVSQAENHHAPPSSLRAANRRSTTGETWTSIARAEAHQRRAVTESREMCRDPACALTASEDDVFGLYFDFWNVHSQEKVVRIRPIWELSILFLHFVIYLFFT